jgi:hypothetical protein
MLFFVATKCPKMILKIYEVCTIQITISFGTAPFDGSCDSDIHDSFKNADIAM